MPEPEPLRCIEHRIFQSQGALYEGDVFSILLHSPFVVRLFEFALADGAIDCDSTYDGSSSYARRLWDVSDRGGGLQEMASRLLLFEVKSTVGGEAGCQDYIATTGQRRRVAFFIGITAADPTYVDIIPNYHQELDALNTSASRDGDERELTANITRICRQPPKAYRGLDQCMNPYRMPIALLLEAIRRIRSCISDGTVYVNPWTRVQFSSWKPATTTTVSWLHPAEHTAHASASMAVLEVLRLTSSACNLELDIVGLQPRLGDFKLRIPSTNGARSRQVFVQHKLDDPVRARDAALDRVCIARGEGRERHFYFSGFDRFDFLWFEFKLSLKPESPGVQTVFYFLPEKELPDEFYTTVNKFVSFELVNFHKYRIVMDSRGDWMSRVHQIIIDTPSPRKFSCRPLRATQLQPQPDVVLYRTTTPSPLDRAKGMQEYRDELVRCQRRLFNSIMTLCAQRMSGVLLVLANNHPLGDYAYARYRWSCQERDRFVDEGQVPIAAHQVPPDVEVVPICHYTQFAECYYQGPMVRPKQFRRLDSCAHGRLIAWDLAGIDTATHPMIPVFIPSNDITITDPQRRTFLKALDEPQSRIRTPLLSAILSTGRFASDYGVVSDGGPLSYNHQSWKDVLALLDCFVAIAPFYHPSDIIRNPHIYRHTMQTLNQRLEAEHGYGSLPQDYNEE